MSLLVPSCSPLTFPPSLFNFPPLALHPFLLSFPLGASLHSLTYHFPFILLLFPVPLLSSPPILCVNSYALPFLYKNHFPLKASDCFLKCVLSSARSLRCFQENVLKEGGRGSKLDLWLSELIKQCTTRLPETSPPRPAPLECPPLAFDSFLEILL